VFCQRGRKKKGRPRLEVYPEGFPRKYGRRLPESEEVDGGVGPDRGRWKPAILAFLCARPETGARRRGIAEDCVGLIQNGTLVTAVCADDRPQVDRIISLYLQALKTAGEVVPQPGKVYLVTARGLAWLERHSGLAADNRPPNGSGQASPCG